MWFRASADLVLVAHFAFVLFVIFGGFLVWRWPRVAWIHLPVAVYGAVIEFLGFICPLTPLEVSLRRRGREPRSEGVFIELYIAAAIFPSSRTRHVQIILGVGVLALIILVYAIWCVVHSALRKRET